MVEDDIQKVQKVLAGVNAWKGLGGLTTADLPLDNIQLYVCLSNQSSSLMSKQDSTTGHFIPGGSIKLRPILASPLNKSRPGGIFSRLTFGPPSLALIMRNCLETS